MSLNFFSMPPLRPNSQKESKNNTKSTRSCRKPKTRRVRLRGEIVPIVTAHIRVLRNRVENGGPDTKADALAEFRDGLED